MCQSFDVADKRATAAIDALEADATTVEINGGNDMLLRAKIAGAILVQDIFRRVFRGEETDESTWTIGKGSGIR